jgi:hypothetical protein
MQLYYFPKIAGHEIFVWAMKFCGFMARMAMGQKI